jgi:endonuclease G
VVVNKERRLPFFSACNIDGSATSSVARSGDFRPEGRIAGAFQTGEEFYTGRGDIFDKGHMTKFEDVMWGTNDSSALKELGKNTFWYPNSAPQHYSLNRGMWSSLEKYLLDSETDKLNLKICLFTGPVLLENDPVLIDKINGNDYKVPMHFWKVVIFKHNQKLHGVGFIMSHSSLVRSSGQLKPSRLMERFSKVMALFGEIPYVDYNHSNPYQVSVEFISKLTDLDFNYKDIVFPFKESRPQELIFSKVDIVKTKKLTDLHESEKKMIDREPDLKIRSNYIFKNMVLS